MRRVRLTEGQLHNVIRESVSQILNEIDWKTYENAAYKKARRMKNPGDMDEWKRETGPLLDAAYRALHRKYPHLQSALNKNYADEPLTPEEQEELEAYDEEYFNFSNNYYKYEKGGRGYYFDDDDDYLDDEDE